MRTHSKILMLLLMLMLLPLASAIPTTNAATLIGSNNATLNGAGAVGEAWFVWGQVSGSEYWITPNRTPVGGVMTYRISQAPLFGSSVFYFRACDQTGCGNQRSFSTAVVTPIPSLNIGGFYQNITESGLDIPAMGSRLIDPYIWTGTPITIIFMLVFSPVFIGVWLRSRTVIVALLLGFITGSFILFANNSPGAIGISMPPEVVGIAQAMCYLAFAGAVLYIVHR